MNYEEMLKAREGMMPNKEQLPMGSFYKKQIDRKYRFVVELKPTLADSLLFCDGLRRDQQIADEQQIEGLIPFKLHEDSGGVYELEFLSGSYLTLNQLLYSNPAIVAQRGFVDDLLKDLGGLLERLHEQGIYQLCLAPQNIFVTKSGYNPALLCHGSSYRGMKNQSELYDGFQNFVAPEVLDGGEVDARSDVYALGRLIEQLYSNGPMPSEYKLVVKKATAEDPEKRYGSPLEMLSAVVAKRTTKRSLITLAGAVVVGALLVWLFFDLLPEKAHVEFVDGKGLKEEKDPFAEEYETEYTDDMDPYLDPEIVAFLDSIGPMSDDEVKKLSDSINSVQTLERIFNRRFGERAKKTLSKLYEDEQLGSSETEFMGKSGQAMDELMEYARKLSEETGIPMDQANSLASQIISRTQTELQKNVTKYGAMTEKQPDNE